MLLTVDGIIVLLWFIVWTAEKSKEKKVNEALKKYQEENPL